MDLDIRRVFKSIPKNHGPEELVTLSTPWGDAIDQPRASGHPRPLLARRTWQSLDGWWECQFVHNEQAATAWRDAPLPTSFGRHIRVPFSPEASLSGVGRQLKPNELLWYRHSFAAPQIPPRGSCLLHFDGVDFACAVYVNGSKVAEHEGAYLPFAIDITHLVGEGRMTVALCVYDPSEQGTQLRGKQRLERGGMWYTAQSGIWQSVWLEVVPRTHVEELLLEPDVETGELAVSVRSSGIAMLDVSVACDGVEIAQGIQSRRVSGRMGLVLPIPEHRLWTPENPTVYDVTVRYGEDVVDSYAAFRTVGIEADEDGVMRFCLNHRPYFLRGLLDQGYWPDGLLTPPSDEALAYDVDVARDAGFNLLRKHIKIESERFYEICDRKGILVMQDVPSGGAVPSDHWSRNLPTMLRRSWHTHRDDTDGAHKRFGAADEAYRQEWTHTCEDMVGRLAGHPCIAAWLLFNESWGQFDAAAATEMVRGLDPTRPILSTSGWYDQGCGDIHGVHNYFRGLHMFEDPFVPEGRRGSRAQMYSEFGGLTWSVDGHVQLPHAYGYAEYDSENQWRLALDEVLADMDALEAQGLSGYVYTQLSDVEEETNGLLTYDRRVNKLKE